MRRLLVVLAAVAVSLCSASPAYAKGPNTATLAGPGIAAPIRLEMRSDGTIPATLDDLAEGTRLWDLLSDRPGTTADAPAGDLGAKYLVTYDFGCPIADGATDCGPNPRRLEVRQDVYPFAATGPQVYTPPNQMVYGNPLPSGWLPASSVLAPTLAALGVPAPGVPSRSLSAQTLTPQQTPRSSGRLAGVWPSVAVVGAGLLAAAGLTVVLWRRRWRGRTDGCSSFEEDHQTVGTTPSRPQISEAGQGCRPVR